MSDVFGKKLKFGENPTGKVTIFNVETGEAIERWPVDARGMVTHGGFTMEPPASTEGAPVEAEGVPETQSAPTTERKLHPLSTDEAPVPLKLGEATEAKPIEVPTAAKKRRAKSRKPAKG